MNKAIRPAIFKWLQTETALIFCAGRWYRLAAEQGHAETQVALGAMYALGMGRPSRIPCSRTCG